MTNAELIKALRWCGNEDERNEMCVDETYRCPVFVWDRDKDSCKQELMRTAADAIEKLMVTIDLYRKATGVEIDINLIPFAEWQKRIGNGTL